MHNLAPGEWIEIEGTIVRVKAGEKKEPLTPGRYKLTFDGKSRGKNRVRIEPIEQSDDTRTSE